MAINYMEETEVVVHHAYEVSVEDVVRFCITKSHNSPTLYWSEGILFYYEQVPPIMNINIEADFVKGKDHWSEVYYSKLKDYKETMEIDEGEFKGAKIRVIDASKFSPHSEFSKWAKAR